jgi:predicted amidophosphoribosyltransferase
VIPGAVSGLADLLLPGGCVSCGSWVPLQEPRSLVCPRCRSRLAEAPWPRCARCHFPRGTGRLEAIDDCLHCRDWPDELIGARTAFVLRPPATALVHGLKYGGWRALADLMGSRMAHAGRELSRLLPPPGGKIFVVPVPTTAARLRTRGYNQAGLLAERVGGALGVPVLDALLRVRGGASQTALPPDARRENVRGAFGVPDPVALRRASVLLVDDVLTTGATAAEATAELAAAGVSRVGMLAFARALPGAAAAGRGAAAA